MTPVSSNDFKTGMTILIDGNVYKVLEFLHVKPGKTLFLLFYFTIDLFLFILNSSSLTAAFMKSS